MEHIIPHDLGRAGARALLETAVARHRAELPEARPGLRWLDDDVAQLSGKVGGWSLVARVEVGEEEVRIDLTLPPDGSIPESQAHRVLEAEAARWLVHARGQG